MKDPNTIQQKKVQEPSTLLSFLSSAFPDFSRNKLKKFLANGLVSVDGNVTTQFDFALKPGMDVAILRKTDAKVGNNPYIKYVYEDPWLIVIDKSPGILSMQSDHHSFCVKTLIDEYFRQRHLPCSAHVVHRLDRETSGLMVFAKSSKVQQLFEKDWHDIVKDRRYIAVVSGRMEQQQGTVRSWLKDNKFFYTCSSPVDNGGKLAITHFDTVDSVGNYSLVELQLETGRKNQIRVHLQTLNHPVVGDTKYGIENDDPIGRLGLHAFRLFFTHPVTGRPMEFETPYPASFVKLFDRNLEAPRDGSGNSL